MAITTGGHIKDLNEFLQRLSQDVSTGSGSRRISKTKCQTMKENLNTIVKHVDNNIRVSTIRAVLHDAENNVGRLTPTIVGQALEEFRRVTGLLNKEHAPDKNKESFHHKGQQQQDVSRKENRLQQEIRTDTSSMRQQEYHSMETSTYGRKQEQDRERADMKREIDELKLRLSSIAGDRLKAGNSSVADLSDPNRPTSIAKQHRELYDNEWTNALEELIKNRITEQQAVVKLGDILKRSYKITKQLSQESIMTMRDAITASLHNIGDSQSTRSSGHATGSTRSIDAHIMAIRRENVEMSIPSVQQKCCKEMQDINKTSHSHVYHYARQCARLTWLMNIQDPPLVLKWATEGDRFQPEYFSEFTSRGTTVDFTTWPALLIQENGDLLAKGVAQPKRK